MTRPAARLHDDATVTDLPRRPLADHDGFTSLHVGAHFSVLLRVNEHHVTVTRQAIAERMGVPVGAIRIEWPWKREAAPARLRRVA